MARAPVKTDSTTVAEAVTKRLREEIQSGDLQPGQRLRQAHVAADYGVSTTPVRESFVKLEREGLLVSTAHRGVVVFEPTIQDLNELYEIRIPLEALATELAVPNLTDDDLGILREALTGMKEAGETEDAELGGRMNELFHMTIYAAAKRPRLLRLIEGFRASSQAYLAIFVVSADNRVVHTEEEHQAIYDACAKGSPKAAVKAMEAHLHRTVEVVAGGLEDKVTATQSA
jgi:DNA-binding GntR family transcriptional regulator